VIAVGGLTGKNLVGVLLQNGFDVESTSDRSPEFETYTGPDPVVPNMDVFRMLDKYGFQIEFEGYRSSGLIPQIFPFEYLWVLSNLLSDLLFQEIREKLALAYAIGTELEHAPGHYAIHLDGTVKPGKITEVAHVVDEILGDIRESSFREHKQRLIADYRLQDRSLSSIRSTATSQIVREGKITTYTNAIGIINDMAFQDLQLLLHYLTPARRFTELMSP
jgi:predicted Zn-dependent peptidase